MAAGLSPDNLRESSTSVGSFHFNISPLKKKESNTGRNVARLNYETIQKVVFKHVKPRNMTAVRA